MLSPAGDLIKLRRAIEYGADAVYIGGRFGLRAGASVDDMDMKEAVKFAHEHGRKVYVTVNIYARNRDLDAVRDYVIGLEKIGVDAVIVAELGVLKIVRENTKLCVHISTQANILNKYAADEYIKLGASRIVLARECSIDEIREIATHVAGRCEIEVFVHGAMCISYSGRCMLSNYMIGREANRGECAHPCRWKYTMIEEKRPGEAFTMEQDAHGTYVMNSRDLCLVGHLGALADAGVTSFKIEGRTKSEYYVASVTSLYRRTLDALLGGLRPPNPLLESDKIPHRPYTTGFVFNDDTMFTAHPNPVSTHDVVAVCLGGERVELRNAFCVGDVLEIVAPDANHNKTFTVAEIRDDHGVAVPRANKPAHVYQIKCPIKLGENYFLRKTRN